MIRTDGKWKREFIPVSSDCAANSQTQISKRKRNCKELQLSQDVSLLLTILHPNVYFCFGSTGWLGHWIFLQQLDLLVCLALWYPSCLRRSWVNKFGIAKTKQRFLSGDKRICLLSVCLRLCLFTAQTSESHSDAHQQSQRIYHFPLLIETLLTADNQYEQQCVRWGPADLFYIKYPRQQIADLKYMFL